MKVIDGYMVEIPETHALQLTLSVILQQLQKQWLVSKPNYDAIDHYEFVLKDMCAGECWPSWVQYVDWRTASGNTSRRMKNELTTND